MAVERVLRVRSVAEQDGAAVVGVGFRDGLRPGKAGIEAHRVVEGAI